MDRVGAARGVAALNAGAIWSETEGDVAQPQRASTDDRRRTSDQIAPAFNAATPRAAPTLSISHEPTAGVVGGGDGGAIPPAAGELLPLKEAPSILVVGIPARYKHLYDKHKAIYAADVEATMKNLGVG
ncbi:hypothetical protein QYE76_055707 [Lolium multiflorum]|uniref:Uncharacterized protein n=1 Tax=Lolium multiflorum TaxID=4521 RepID=A0AAD8T1W5_LOLMU|nr:hypothetical protein QYE76_055707 [Lolium multiflorum]